MKQRSQIIALAVTLVLFVMLVVFLVANRMNVNAADDHEWPPKRHAEIILEPQEDEFRYVPMLSDSADNVAEPDNGADDYGPSDVASEDPTQTSNDLTNAGHSESAATNPVTSNVESPVKQRNTDKADGNRHPNPEDEAAAAAKRQQQAAQNIDRQLQNRFSGAGKNGGKSNDNDADGKSSAPGRGTGQGLGMTASVNQTPASTKSGVIVVSCVVLPDGTVKPGSVKFRSQGSSGAAATDQSLKSRCVEAAYRCRFSRPTSDTDERPGTIRFHWVDKAD